MKRVAVILGVLAVAAVLYERPDRLIRIASGSVSQILCSKTFVSGLDPVEITRRICGPRWAWD